MVYPTVVPELLRPGVGFLSRWSRAQPGCQNLEIQMSSEVGGRKKKKVLCSNLAIQCILLEIFCRKKLRLLMGMAWKWDNSLFPSVFLFPGQGERCSTVQIMDARGVF